MFDQGFQSLQAHGQVFLILQGLDDTASFGQDIWLDQALVTLSGIPIFTKGHAHQSLVLLDVLEGMGQIFDQVLLGELLVAFLNVQDDTLETGVLA